MPDSQGKRPGPRRHGTAAGHSSRRHLTQQSRCSVPQQNSQSVRLRLLLCRLTTHIWCLCRHCGVRFTKTQAGDHFTPSCPCTSHTVGRMQETCSPSRCRCPSPSCIASKETIRRIISAFVAQRKRLPHTPLLCQTAPPTDDSNDRSTLLLNNNGP